VGEQPEVREARLRQEFASHYPYLKPGVWELASVLPDQVVAHILGWPNARFISKERALDPAHFEFRGSYQPLVTAGECVWRIQPQSSSASLRTRPPRRRVIRSRGAPNLFPWRCCRERPP
jgi:hypothetical protein